jgi:GTP cyclohydrolase FolE2
MNAPERIFFPDIQSQIDSRDIHFDGVGIKGMRYPVTISAREEPVATIADLSLSRRRASRTCAGCRKGASHERP